MKQRDLNSRSKNVPKFIFGFISFKAHLRLASFGPLIFVQNIIVEIVHSVSAAYFRLSE